MSTYALDLGMVVGPQGPKGDPSSVDGISATNGTIQLTAVRYGATQSLNGTQKAKARSNIGAVSALDIMPIGYIYISTAATSPAELFGGTWTQIKDRFLLATGDTYSAGYEGGEAWHTLAASEMPPHSHGVSIYVKNAQSEDATNQLILEDGTWSWSNQQVRANPTLLKQSSAGGGDAHNNMPPYVAVYMWKRIA